MSKRQNLIPRYIVLVAIAAVFVVPLVWMLLTSLKSYSAAQQSPPTWMPSSLTTATAVDERFAESVMLCRKNMAAATLPAGWCWCRIPPSTVAGGGSSGRLIFAMIVATCSCAREMIIRDSVADTIDWLDTSRSSSCRARPRVACLHGSDRTCPRGEEAAGLDGGTVQCSCGW